MQVSEGRWSQEAERAGAVALRGKCAWVRPKNSSEAKGWNRGMEQRVHGGSLRGQIIGWDLVQFKDWLLL